MDYNDYYNTEYQKIMLKESLKRGIAIKNRLTETIEKSDKQGMLEFFLQTNDFEGQIASDEMMLQDLGEDEEFKELIEKDIETTKQLKKTAEDRLRELKEQDKENEDKENEDEQHDERYGKAHNSEQDSSLVDNDIENYQDLQFTMPITKIRFVPYGSQEYYIANIKFNIMKSINSLQQIKMNVDRCPSPMMLAYMSGEREFFDNFQDFSRNLQKMPGCDEELRMLATEQIQAIQEVKDTVDKYIEQYRQRAEHDSKKKDEEQTSLEEMEERLQQEEEKEPEEKEQEKLEQEDDGVEQDTEELEQQNDGLKQEDDTTPRKSWELPPKQKEAIQISTRQVAHEHMERQNNPEPVQEQPTIEATSTGFDR